LIGVVAFFAAFDRQWVGVLAAAAAAGLLAVIAVRVGRPSTVESGVTGREKAREHEDPPN
jgi:hypothetical protein